MPAPGERRPAMSTRSLDKTGTLTLGNQAWRQPSVLCGGRQRQDHGRGRRIASLADETPEGRSSSCWPRRRTAVRSRGMASWVDLHPLHGTDPHERVSTRGGQLGAQGRGRSHSKTSRRGAAWSPSGNTVRSDPAVAQLRVGPRAQAISDEIAKIGRHAARVGGKGTCTHARRVQVKDIVKGRHPREFCRAFRCDGHPHVMDHRRKPDDGGRNRSEAGVDDFPLAQRAGQSS